MVCSGVAIFGRMYIEDESVVQYCGLIMLFGEGVRV